MIDIINKRVLDNPDKILIKYKNQNISYLSMNAMINNASTFINNHKTDKYIGIQIHNKLKLLITILAANKLNLIPIIYPLYPNIADYIKTTKIPINLTDNDIELNNKSSHFNAKTNYQKKTKTQFVIFTSGTSGQPKACEISYENIEDSLKMWNNIIKFNLNDIYLNHMPLTHISGLSIFYRALYYNFIMELDNFNNMNFLQKIQNNSFNIVSMVPTMIEKIKSINPSLKSLKNLKAIIIGGSKINKEIQNIIFKSNIPAYISYGMTETSSGIAGYWGNKSQETIYKPHNNVNIYVDKSKIVIQSKAVMKKYFNGKKTNQIFTTSDVGEINNNQLYLHNRIDDIIQSGGESVSIEYVKNYIESYSEVKKCIIKIVPNNEWGNIMHAYIKFNTIIEDNMLLKKLKLDLPKHMIPKKIIKL